MNHSISILLQNVSVKDYRLEFCFILSDSEWVGTPLARSSNFISVSPTEKLSEWVLQGQLIDTTITLSKLEYVLQKNTVKFCVWIQFKTMQENQQRYLAQESYFFFLSLWVTVWQFFLIQEKRKYSAQGRPFFIYPFYLIHLTHFISCWKPGPGLHPTGPPDK